MSEAKENKCKALHVCRSIKFKKHNLHEQPKFFRAETALYIMHNWFKKARSQTGNKQEYVYTWSNLLINLSQNITHQEK